MDYSKYTVETLSKMLLNVVSVEDYESAAQIRDEINNRGGADCFMDLDSQIKIIIDNVDFHKIHSVMEFLDWKVFGKVPTINTLITKAKNLLVEVWNAEEGHEVCAIETGGMRVERYIYDGMKMLKLRFIISSWSIDYDDVTLTYDEYVGN